MQIRKLTESEVEFTLEVEPEDIPVRGNYLASGDDEADREAENEILDQLDRGFIEVWCCLVVKAKWEGFEGFASLGECSYAPMTPPDVIQQDAREHRLYSKALDDLNRNIAAMYCTTRKLEE